MALKNPDRYYQEFWKLFNAEKFFEAHEVLETLWRQTHGPERDFYQGLIQIAAAFVHIQKGTPDGARKLLDKASKKLQKYGPVFHGLDLHALLEQSTLVLQSKAPFPRIPSPPLGEKARMRG